MRVTQTQLLPLLLLLLAMFGCKAGEVFKVASAVAITTVKVAALAAAASSHSHHPEAGNGTAVWTAEDERRSEAGNAPGQCTELFVETVPAPAPGAAPPRAADCGGNMLIQDSEGHWRRYGKDATPAIQEP
ncbi:MAG: hypothetical protein ABJE95_28350 [Byssovorax sp.]